MEVRQRFERNRVQFSTTGVSLTHQSMKRECDINAIMSKWQKTGILEHRNNYQGQYGDFTNTPQDYQESMNQVLAAQEMFESLPSSVRRRFGNDPGAFLDFVADPDNLDEMKKMGLTKAETSLIEDEGSPKPAKPVTKPKGESTPPEGQEKPPGSAE